MANTLSKEFLSTGIFVGRVVDNDDPNREGRCRIMVFGIFDFEEPVLDKNNKPIAGQTKRTELPTEDIPWAYPRSNNFFAGGDGGFGNLSVPKIGTIVSVNFCDGNIYSPEYSAIMNINTDMQAAITNSYLNSHVFGWDQDENLRVYYTPDNGMEIFLRDSHITINPDTSITIEHSGSESIIELIGPNINITCNSSINLTSNSLIRAESTEVAMNGSAVTKLGPAPTYSAVLAEPLWTFLKSLATAVDGKLPSTPGVYSSQAAAFEQLSTSKNVKVSS
jgi:hypothetical protein